MEKDGEERKAVEGEERGRGFSEGVVDDKAIETHRSYVRPFSGEIMDL